MYYKASFIIFPLRRHIRWDGKAGRGPRNVRQSGQPVQDGQKVGRRRQHIHNHRKHPSQGTGSSSS